MLRSIKQLYGKKLGTSDGDIGHVKDFYFNDQQWAVRYVIADTGTWLLGRLVLISPDAFGNFHQDGERLLVNLTRQQIGNSPAIESHKPVLRQHEGEYNPYYNSGDPHLRSTQTLTGYQIPTSDGAIGQITGFIMDDKSWEIRHLVVDTGL